MVDEPSVELGIPGLGPATRIGSGGFADVYRATQTNLRREVAVKVLRAAANDTQGKMRFERECHAVGAVSGHPNIVGVHEGGFTADGRAYLIMEYCPGGSLLDRIERDGSMPAADVIEIGQKIGRALGVAHDAGVLHRDVKPANILVTAYGEPALADFGIARVEGGQQTATGLVTASLAHAAPEVLGGEGPTSASDIYSLGSTLFELVAGEAPHARSDEQSVWALMNRVISEPVPDPATRNVPEPLATVIRRATAKTPTERYATAAELVTGLTASPPSPGPAAPPAAWPPPTAPVPDQGPTVALGPDPLQPTTVAQGQDSAWTGATAAPGSAAPPTVPTPEVSAPPGRTLDDVAADRTRVNPGFAPPDDRAADPAASERGGSGRRWPIAVGAFLLLALAGAGATTVALASDRASPAPLAFEFPVGSDGPLDAGESYELSITGAEPGTRFRYVIDGSPIGTPVEELGPFVAQAGRHAVAVEVTQGDSVQTTPAVELYGIGELPEPGFRANLASVTAQPANWPSALDAFDRLTAEGHTDLQLLPSDRFPALRAGFWNLFVPGFDDERDEAIAYCDEFELAVPDDCFVSFFDPSA